MEYPMEHGVNKASILPLLGGGTPLLPTPAAQTKAETDWSSSVQELGDCVAGTRGRVNAVHTRRLSDIEGTRAHPELNSLASIETTLDPEALALDSLVEQTLAGDERAFALLVARMQPRVQRWVQSYAANPDEADDIAQESFVLALRRLRQYRGGGSFPVWLYRITLRAAGRIRKKARHREALVAGPMAIPDRLVYETDPGARVDRERLGALVREFWEELPERQRAVVDLVDLQGYTPAVAAVILDINPATLRANLFKGRQSLRLRLLACYPSLAAQKSREEA